MTLVYDGPHLVFKVAGMGPYDNNGYVIADPATKEAYLVDAPAEIERLLTEADGFQVKGVIVTHTHPDHVAGYADLKRLTDLPVSVHESDARRLPGEPDALLAHNDELSIGASRIRILHTPGHTPGALCLFTDGTLVSGDTLFPGGPGRTNTSDDLRQVVQSIEERAAHAARRRARIAGPDGADTTGRGVEGGVRRLQEQAAARRPVRSCLVDSVSHSRSQGASGILLGLCSPSASSRAWTSPAGRVVKGTSFVSLRDAGDPVELAAFYDREGRGRTRLPSTSPASSDGARHHHRGGGARIGAGVHPADRRRRRPHRRGRAGSC